MVSEDTTQPTPPALTDSLDWSLREWVEYHQREIVLRQVRYRGVPCWKNVMDLWIYQEIMRETEIEAVVEIGVAHGGTSLWLSDMLRLLASERGLVVSVDLIQPERPLPANVTFVQGDSLDPNVISAVRNACGGKRTMVIADGNHAAEH